MNYLDNIGFLLQHLSAKLGKQNDLILQEKLGIGYSQFKLLIVIQWKPSLGQKQIAQKLSQTEASISRQIKLMLDNGLLKITTDSKDRRQHITNLTPRGERLAQQSKELLSAYYSSIFNKLPKEEYNTLISSLNTINEILNNNKAN